MMGKEKRPQGKLFYTGFSLDQRIPTSHPLRKISQLIDCDFVYHEVKDKYGVNGNVSIPPPMLLKLMLFLVIYNVRSERELMQTLGMRLDWLEWFLGLDLDSDIPDHSVLSKVRKLWGVEVRNFFERRLEEQEASGEPEHPNFKKVNKKRVSTTDPDSSITRDGGAKLVYKIHRGVDGANEVITATRTTPGDTHESHILEALVDEHQANTENSVETVVADAQYGTVKNLLKCNERKIATQMPHLGSAAQKGNAAKGVFGIEHFRYAPDKDLYLCPAGHELKSRGYDRQNRHIVYKASKTSYNACQLKDHCTKSKNGRAIRRHERQASLDKKHQEG